MLRGHLDVFVEDESGKRLTTRVGPWECISCPAGVIHGYQNDSLEPVYFQVMLGRDGPETMGYADEELYKRPTRKDIERLRRQEKFTRSEPRGWPSHRLQVRVFALAVAARRPPVADGTGAARR